MRKERVVVFDGEDKFIVPKNVIYNKFTGEAQMIGERNYELLPNQPIVSAGRAREEFDGYMRRQNQVAIMPSPVEPDFCNQMNQFISTNGNGLATPEQIMQAYNIFQQNCVEREQPRTPIADTPTPPSPVRQPQPIQEPVREPQPPEQEPTPIFQPRQIIEPQPISQPQPVVEPQPQPQPVAETKKEPEPIKTVEPAKPATINLSAPFVPLAVPTLGQRPMGGGAVGGGGGGGEQEQEQKRKPNLLIWLIVGGVALYFLTRKSN